ncbi:MAG: hypothetical protein AB9836_14520 [Aminipila sp.]
MPETPTPDNPVEPTKEASNGAVGENASGGYMAPGSADEIVIGGV